MVIFLAVSPGAPSWIFPFLQHILLPNIAWMLKSHPSDDEVETQMRSRYIRRGGGALEANTSNEIESLTVQTLQ